MAQNHRDPTSFSAGLHSGLGIAIGYTPIAITYGLLAKNTGLGLPQAIAMSGAVFAGASQFLAINLLSIGAGAYQIILAVFLVNIRHLLMGASLAQKVGADSRPVQAIYSFGITDETFAVSSMISGTPNSRFMLGLTSIAYFSWVLNSSVGFMLGGRLPGVVQTSLPIALYALFLGLLVPEMRRSKKVLLLGVSAGGMNSFLRLFLSGGWSIILATVISAIIVELCAELFDLESG